MNEKKLHVKTAVIVMSLVIFVVIATGIASAQIAPPTVSKSAAPTNINIAGSGVNEETTITLTVTGTGSTTTTTVPMDVVFALDSSGSMDWNDPSDLRKEAAKDFVDKMDSSKDLAGVVSWDDGIDFTQALTNNFPLVKSKIDAVDSSGGTNLDVGLTSAIGLLDAGKQAGASWVIIFLSDGDGTYHHSTAVTAADKGYTVYTIGLSMSSGSTAENNLKDIASTTGGKYYSSPSASNLDAIFNDIYKSSTIYTKK
jgi:Ca-activated chloride channel family protein